MIQQEFFDFEKNNSPRAILIRSKCIPVVEAKLEIYRRYKHCINKGTIFLQHEYEDFDEVAKFSAYEKLSSFCCYVELVVDTFTTDLYTSLKEYYGKKFTKQICKDVTKHIKILPFESTGKKGYLYFYIIKMNILSREETLRICKLQHHQKKLR